jgi:hypothetical protein
MNEETREDEQASPLQAENQEQRLLNISRHTLNLTMRYMKTIQPLLEVVDDTQSRGFLGIKNRILVDLIAGLML